MTIVETDRVLTGGVGTPSGRSATRQDTHSEAHGGRHQALVASLQDITATLAAADPAAKAKVYAEMGIDITYHQEGRVVVESRPGVVESSVGELISRFGNA